MENILKQNLDHITFFLHACIYVIITERIIYLFKDILDEIAYIFIYMKNANSPVFDLSMVPVPGAATLAVLLTNSLLQT